VLIVHGNHLTQIQNAYVTTTANSYTTIARTGGTVEAGGLAVDAGDVVLHSTRPFCVLVAAQSSVVADCDCHC
jgi:hypothetical protein